MTVTSTTMVTSMPQLTLTYDGKLRDHLGKRQHGAERGHGAGRHPDPDGEREGRPDTDRAPDADLGVQRDLDTTSATGFWVLGVAPDPDDALLNQAGTMRGPLGDNESFTPLRSGRRTGRPAAHRDGNLRRRRDRDRHDDRALASLAAAGRPVRRAPGRERGRRHRGLLRLTKPRPAEKMKRCARRGGRVGRRQPPAKRLPGVEPGPGFESRPLRHSSGGVGRAHSSVG